MFGMFGKFAVNSGLCFSISIKSDFNRLTIKIMSHQTIAEVYENNDQIREKLKAAINAVTDREANFLPEGEKWTIAALVEHIGIVEGGMSKISHKLLGAAKEAGAAAGDGRIGLSESFSQKAAAARSMKLEAPAQVRPTGSQTIAESLAKMEENRRRLKELQPLFESIDSSAQTFPHPAFGELTAHEWLVLIGGHEARHIAQLNRLISVVREQI